MLGNARALRARRFVRAMFPPASADPAGPPPGLRTAVLRAGAVLGWRRQEVIAFAEALTGCPWPRCTGADLQMVLGEYRDLASAAAAKLARRAARLGGRRPGAHRP
jgi:hypothetical protein